MSVIKNIKKSKSIMDSIGILENIIKKGKETIYYFTKDGFTYVATPYFGLKVLSFKWTLDFNKLENVYYKDFYTDVFGIDNYSKYEKTLVSIEDGKHKMSLFISDKNNPSLLDENILKFVPNDCDLYPVAVTDLSPFIFNLRNDECIFILPVRPEPYITKLKDTLNKLM